MNASSLSITRLAECSLRVIKPCAEAEISGQDFVFENGLREKGLGTSSPTTSSVVTSIFHHLFIANGKALMASQDSTKIMIMLNVASLKHRLVAHAPNAPHFFVHRIERLSVIFDLAANQMPALKCR